MDSISNARKGKAKPLRLRLRNIRKWQLSLILLSAAVITIILSAIFVIPTVRILTQRVSDSAPSVEDPVKRAEFVPISSKLVQENRGLREELSCADRHYEANRNLPGYAIAMDPGCDGRISIFDAYLIQKEMPLSIYGYSNFSIEFDGKYYSLIMPPE